MDFTKGKIINFNADRGFGFIRVTEGRFDEDVFFHVKETQFKDPAVGDVVEFYVEKSLIIPGALCCTKVHKVENGENSGIGNKSYRA